MPNRNGQGPNNMGPKTGRGMGFCRNSARITETEQEAVQQQDARIIEYPVGLGCRGLRGCGTGSGGRRGGAGGRRGQR